jgi:D-alanine-D-alanine ligase
LMGLLELAGVPYVGCDLSASVLAMDKVLAKQAVAQQGGAVAPYISFAKSSYLGDVQGTHKAITKKLKYPLFVKPAHLGSSIGISRVSNDQELANGLELAFHYDDKVVVEEEIKNLIEVTLPIMGNSDLTPALLERPLTNSDEFFDFETKYIGGGKKGGAKKGASKGAQGYSELPAQLPKALYESAVKAGLDAYRALGCSGIARIDMLIDSKTKTIYFNEANPLPGSLYAHNWRASGLAPVELVKKLIVLAEERFEQKQQQATAFGTNFLKQF